MRENWRPFTLPWNDSPIDISFVFERERPAGKHGFLTAKGGRFVFQDGTVARFWGTCFNSGANFPPHDYSEMVAERLAKFGVNMVRTHQMDANWATPNIFEFNRAKSPKDTRTFDPESMDRLDYLFYCLREQGIYIYLDINTYRKFLPGDGVEAVDQLPWGHNPYCYFDPKLIALQKEFARDLWCHINPYTRAAYKDDPAIALSEIQNESDLLYHGFALNLEPYRTRLDTLYRVWADQHGIRVGPEKVDFGEKTEDVARFIVELESGFNRDLVAFLRDIGVRIPITGNNMSSSVGELAANLVCDYTDSHCYWNFPRWEFPDGTDIRPMVGEVRNTFITLSQMRALHKPFFVSEWDHAWPAPYRAESPLAYAAVGALQGWSGFAIHTYRYGTHHPSDRMGATTINGVLYRRHFDTYNDPAKFGLFQHAALLFRRGDVCESETTVAIEFKEDTPNWRTKRAQQIPALVLTTEKHRVGLALPGAPCEANSVVGPGEQLVDEDAGEVVSDTGEVGRSWRQRYGWIDSPRTKAAYGFLGALGEIELNGLSLRVKTEFATIAISSLTDDPICDARCLLLTAVGQADNAGASYDDEGRRQLDAGHAPVLIEPIEAHIELTSSHPNLKVWVIADNKEAVTRLPTEYRDGVLSFDIGPQPTYNPSTIYYLIRI